MKPIIILPHDTVSAADIKLLRDNGLCVVEAKNPAAVKFVDPIPSYSSRTQIENAAIQLSRKLLAGELVGQEWKKNVANLYVELLVKGSPLDSNPTKEEQEQEVFGIAKNEELRRLAREAAKEARQAAANKVKPTAE